MKIIVKNVDPGSYTLKFDDAEVVLEEDDIKELLLQITKIMLPIYGGADNAERKSKEFLNLIKDADDVCIQKIIGIADEDDILVFLKSVEQDEALLNKFYSNMSERLRKMITEDLTYKFQESDQDDMDKSAFGRLLNIAKDLREKGILGSKTTANGSPSI